MSTIRGKLKTFSKRLGAGVLAQFFLGTAAFGMCIGFFPPGRSVQPADNTKTLIVFQDGVQHLIVQPEFVGSLEDFGLVMPAPTQPDVSEAPADLFTKLEDYTNPELEFQDTVLESTNSLLSGDVAERSVTVIDRKDVGQYTATILKANDATKLNEWLEQNGYESDQLKDDVMSYYVREGGYFVALKVNMSAITSQRLEDVRLAQGNIDSVDSSASLSIDPGWPGPIGNSFLDPIDISYRTDEPRLPTRLLAASPQTLAYTVYTLSAEPYIIPGGDVEFSKKLGVIDAISENARVLLPYNPAGQWLVRNKIWVNPERAQEDLILTRIASSGSSTVDADNRRRNVNPLLWTEQSGVVRQDCFGQRTFDSELNRWVNTPTLSPNDCNFSYTFDLGIGEVDDSSGLPIVGTLRILVLGLVVLLVIQRVRAYRARGAEGLVPRPDKAVMSGMQWVDSKTNHKIFGKKGHRSVYWLFTRNIVIFLVGILLTRWMAEGVDDSSWRRDLNDAEEIIVATIVTLPFFLTQGLLFFITPTKIALYRGKRELINYILVTIAAAIVFLLAIT